MAGYKAHMAFGIVTGLGWAIVAFMLSLVSAWFIPLIFIFTVMGAFLPDLDSDTGMPLKILLMVFSVIGSIFTGWIVINQEGHSLLELFGVPLFTGLFIYYGIGSVFKKLTHHRGIFHSIPAVILATLVTLTVLNHFELDTNIIITLSLGVGLGYLCHLILDELNSVVNLGGIPFIPNKSIGTALKLYSKNWKTSLVVYVAISWFLYQNWGNIMDFIK
ncbi:MAG: hypothetical protein HOF39_05160 [Candidatus Marinimicrobia bacterium]|jgi:membrane-bound metal-dependent hydrolase YbcI (DUF457 family)|nr:hypothetical protein [Candidatus Neomarinimicrobiota bacterium]